jgi:hypothetical protein
VRPLFVALQREMRRNKPPERTGTLYLRAMRPARLITHQRNFWGFDASHLPALLCLMLSLAVNGLRKMRKTAI